MIDYEIMCTQAVDSEFCDCEDSAIPVVNDSSSKNQVLQELYVPQKRQIEDSFRLDIGEKSSATAFIAGIFLTLFVVGIIALIFCFFVRKQRQVEAKKLAFVTNTLAYTTDSTAIQMQPSTPMVIHDLTERHLREGEAFNSIEQQNPATHQQ